MTESFFEVEEKIDSVREICYNAHIVSCNAVSQYKSLKEDVRNIMKKRIVAIALCLIMLVPLFASCAGETNESYLQMYISHQVYDLDPLNAFTNDAQLKIVSLIFSGLYKVDENGKVTEDLAQSLTVHNNPSKKEYKMEITLKDTYWSDGQSAVTANDVLCTFERVLKSQKSNDAAALLYKIKNARDVKSGECSISDLRVYADNKVVTIYFEDEITDADVEEFKMNLTSPALFPLRSNLVEGDLKIDWAKKKATMACSGPFMVAKTSYINGRKTLQLERNSFYFRNREKDADDKYVLPRRIIIDYEESGENQVNLFNEGQVLFLGEIPLALRSEYASKAKVTSGISTHTYLFNQNAVVKSTKAGETDGVKLFAIKEVRQALSLAVDRQAIADLAVFADPATGLVSDRIYADAVTKKLFRKDAGSLLASSADLEAAKKLLADAGINPSDYSFSISVRAGGAMDDDESGDAENRKPQVDKSVGFFEGFELHKAIAESVAKVWSEELGFNVTVKPVTVEEKQEGEIDGTGETQKDIVDDLFDEDYKNGNFEVMAIDLVPKAPTAFALLAPFAYDFTGNRSVDKQNTVETTYITGYNSEAYNELIEKAFGTDDKAESAEYLRQAEKQLLDDAAVMPVVFNKTAVLISDKLSNVKMSYYGTYTFTGARLKAWQDYKNLYFPEDTTSAN